MDPTDLIMIIITETNVRTRDKWNWFSPHHPIRNTSPGTIEKHEFKLRRTYPVEVKLRQLPRSDSEVAHTDDVAVAAVAVDDIALSAV